MKGEAVLPKSQGLAKAETNPKLGRRYWINQLPALLGEAGRWKRKEVGYKKAAGVKQDWLWCGSVVALSSIIIATFQ